MHKKNVSFFTAFILFCILVGVLFTLLPSLLANTEVCVCSVAASVTAIWCVFSRIVKGRYIKVASHNFHFHSARQLSMASFYFISCFNRLRHHLPVLNPLHRQFSPWSRNELC